MIDYDQAAALVRGALSIQPTAVIRQSLTESGNAIFRIEFGNQDPAVLRVSEKPKAFSYTAKNLDALRQLGMPVQTVLASGAAAAGGSFIILNWIPGRDLLHELPEMRSEQMTRVAQSVVDFQKRVGTLPMAGKFGWAPIGKSGAASSWTEMFGASDSTPVAANASKVDQLRGRLRALRQSIEPYFATIQPVCFLDDLTLKNVLIENGELTGIIDVDFVCYGDPLMSVGTTLALIAADVGDAGRFYGEEVVRLWNPSAEQAQAIRFYAALWIIGMLHAAESAGDHARATKLATIANEMLEKNNQPACPLQRPPVETIVDPEQLLILGTRQHRAGNLPQAWQLYRQVLAKSPEHGVARFRLGLLEMQQGNLQVALELIQQAAAKSPGEFRYQFGLGEVLTAMQRWDEAAAAYRRALMIDPQSADAQFGLGNALRSVADYSGAIAAYQAALQIQPDFADASNNLGNCFKSLRDFPQAEMAYRAAIAANPKYAGAMSNLGIVLRAQGRLDEAIERMRAAVAISPNTSSYAVNLVAALCSRRLFSEAQAVLRPVVDRDETNAGARFNLASALHGLGQLRAAAEQYEKAVSLSPEDASALINLGNVYKELGEFKLAAAAYGSAMRLKPDSAEALNNAGCLLRAMGRLEEAEAILRRGLKFNPNHSALQDNLANVLKDGGHLDEAIAGFRRALQLDPANAITHSNLAYALSFQSTEAQPILEECLRWNDQHAAVLRPDIVGHTNDRSPDKRLRIGYVSPDFRDHCQSLFTVPLLSRHDHVAFEIYCYSSVGRPDPLTRRLKGYADVWRDVRPLDDAALADLIRRDGIDILVDLTMHMAEGRPLLFARKPAPLQVAWLAYPGTTGIAAMDYRFSDPRLDPEIFPSPGAPGEGRAEGSSAAGVQVELKRTSNVEHRTSNAEVNAPQPNPLPEYREIGPGGRSSCIDSTSSYSERTIFLPDSFWCYDALADQPDVNELPALSRGQLTLGCLNNPCKLSDLTLRLWGQVMRDLPEAQLLLLAPPGPYRAHLLGRLLVHGITGERVDFVPYRPRGEYLKSYHQIDLGIDTFPYNGHTTSLDSFWMGVPVVTRVGRTCVGRGGLSQLFQLGLTELAAESDAEFIRIVVELARDLPRLANLRRQLRSRLEDSALMDASRFARNMETAYRTIWQEYSPAQAGL